MKKQYTRAPQRKVWLTLIDPLKRLLTVFGRVLPAAVIRNLVSMTMYLQLGKWAKNHGFEFSFRSRNRDDVFRFVSEKLKNEKAVYLEFGVFEGNSMRFWSDHLLNPESQLHGFDSFEGLPEAGGLWFKGEFDVGGKIPAIDDPRVKFHKGWFDQVLPGFKMPEHDVLIINIDADLYSSTIFVLQQLKDYIRPGTYLFFDDLAAFDHEPRAITEFLQETGMKWRGVSAHVSLNHAFFECVAMAEPVTSELRIAG
ncbi:MAG: class I SAM-dependent methyltransferase [Planctomycetaceae bacterium]|nr:class I SAM-dependent methyltransferase [Planctomycetaceae bacterium]